MSRLERQASSGLTTPRMAPDQLGGMSPSGTVPATAYRPGGPGRGLAQGQAPELSVGALVCCARLSRQTGDREHREEDARGGWGPLGHPREESPGHRAHRAVATAIDRVPLKRIYIPKKNGKQSALLDSGDGATERGKPLYLQALQPIAETAGGPQLLWVPAQTPVRGCDRPVFQRPAPARPPPPGSWKGISTAFSINIAFSWLETHIPMNKRRPVEMAPEWLFRPWQPSTRPRPESPKGGSSRP